MYNRHVWYQIRQKREKKHNGNLTVEIPLQWS